MSLKANASFAILKPAFSYYGRSGMSYCFYQYKYISILRSVFSYYGRSGMSYCFYQYEYIFRLRESNFISILE